MPAQSGEVQQWEICSEFHRTRNDAAILVLLICDYINVQLHYFVFDVENNETLFTYLTARTMSHAINGQ